MEHGQERHWGYWISGAIAIAAIILAVLWWRGDLGGGASVAPSSTTSAPAETEPATQDATGQ